MAHALRSRPGEMARGALLWEQHDEASRRALPRERVDCAADIDARRIRGDDEEDGSVGEDVTVSYDTHNLPDGGIVVTAPFLPELRLTPVISASFRCEV